MCLLPALFTFEIPVEDLGESDLAFIERLLREEGISYYFDFAHGPDQIGLHTLLLFDAGTELLPPRKTAFAFTAPMPPKTPIR